MTSSTKMFQTLIDGQVAIRKDLKRLEEKVDGGFQRVTSRVDKIGLSLAELEDDTPTIDEFNALDHRVKKLEHQFVVS